MSDTPSAAVLRDARRIVVKVGSSLVTNEGRGLDERAIGEWCRQLAALARDGREVIMVSSGAIAEGMKRLGWATRPHELNELQAAAAVGQMGLAQMYETKLREMARWRPDSVQHFKEAAEVADRHYRLGAVPISTYVELQKQYLDAVEGLLDTKKEALEAAAQLELLTGIPLPLLHTTTEEQK